MNSILISIIVPIYNKEKYVQQCLDSILAQSLSEIEIICINDGSTDGSYNILRQYDKAYDRIVLINQTNLGVAWARNKGIKRANGEYIAFMDPDDYYPNSEVLKTLYNHAKQNNLLICGGSFQSLRDNKIISKYEGLYTGYTFTKEGIMDYSEYQFDFGFQRFIYQRDFIINNNITFPNLIRFQDPPFFVKAMIMSKKFYAIVEPTYCYREAYKEITWTISKKIDLLSGLSLNLKQSINNYEKLHELTFNRLTSEYYRDIITSNNNAFECAALIIKLKEIQDTVSGTLNKTPLKKIIDDLEKVSSKKKNIDISVIIPVYKVEKYLEECINSVLEQVEAPRYEIICIDDGSPDNSGKICEDYSKKYCNIITVHKKNGGLSSARNLGVDYASGKYIYFLDSDDKLRSDALKTIFHLMELHNLDVLCFDAITFYDSQELERSNSSYKNYYCNRIDYHEVTTGQEILKKFTSNNTYRTPVQLMAINHNYYKTKGLKFYYGILHEDNLFSFECLNRANKVMYVNKGLYYRRIRAGSIMTTKKTIGNYRGYIRCIIEMQHQINSIMLNEGAIDIIEKTKKTAISVYRELSTEEKTKLNKIPLDEYIMGVSLGLDVYNYTKCAISTYVYDNSDDFKKCIFNLSNQTIPIKVTLVDSMQTFPNCININQSEMEDTISGDMSKIVIIMKNNPILYSDAIFKMTYDVVFNKKRNVSGDIIIFNPRQQKYEYLYNSSEYESKPIEKYGASIINPDKNIKQKGPTTTTLLKRIKKIIMRR